MNTLYSISEHTTSVRPLSTVLKTLTVLDELGTSTRGMRLAEVVRVIGGGRSTVYQKLQTLVAAGWVEQMADGSYRLSMHAARIGNAALQQASLGERVVPLLQKLVYEVNETASLAVLDGHMAYIVQRVESEALLRADLRIGGALPLDSTASGRVISAFLPEAHRARLLAQGVALPPDAMLEQVRCERFAVSAGVTDPTIRAIGAPIFDAAGNCIAALSLVGPLPRFDPQQHRDALLRYAEAINALIQGKLR